MYNYKSKQTKMSALSNKKLVASNYLWALWLNGRTHLWRQNLTWGVKSRRGVSKLPQNGHFQRNGTFSKWTRQDLTSFVKIWHPTSHYDILSQNVDVLHKNLISNAIEASTHFWKVILKELNLITRICQYNQSWFTLPVDLCPTT